MRVPLAMTAGRSVEERILLARRCDGIVDGAVEAGMACMQIQYHPTRHAWGQGLMAAPPNKVDHAQMRTKRCMH
jgi:hypothetical protein